MYERTASAWRRLLPRKEDGGRPVIGVEPVIHLVFKRYGFFESLRLGFDKTIESVDLTFITLKKLITFNLSIKTLAGR